MRKSLLWVLLMVATSFTAQAQKFALIDMEYILNRIPAYGEATQRIETASKQWQAEVEKLTKEAQTLYTNYQAQAETLGKAERTRREEAVIQKEKEAGELRRKYFGPEGKLYQMREELLQPFEDRVYEAVKTIAIRAGYAAVVDRSSANSLIFASPDIDISEEVLARMGYANE